MQRMGQLKGQCFHLVERDRRGSSRVWPEQCHQHLDGNAYQGSSNTDQSGKRFGQVLQDSMQAITVCRLLDIWPRWDAYRYVGGPLLPRQEVLLDNSSNIV